MFSSLGLLLPLLHSLMSFWSKQNQIHFKYIKFRMTSGRHNITYSTLEAMRRHTFNTNKHIAPPLPHSRLHFVFFFFQVLCSFIVGIRSYIWFNITWTRANAACHFCAHISHNSKIYSSQLQYTLLQAEAFTLCHIAQHTYPRNHRKSEAESERRTTGNAMAAGTDSRAA